MKLAFSGTPLDRAFLPRLNEMIGAHSVKVSLATEEYLAGLAAKIKLHDLDGIICTNADMLPMLLGTQLDFRHPLDKRGLKKRLTLDDYAGSFFTIPAIHQQTYQARRLVPADCIHMGSLEARIKCKTAGEILTCQTTRS